MSIENFGQVRDALEARFGSPRSAKIEWRPLTATRVPDETADNLVKLLDTLDDHDDVQNLYGNYELSDALMAKLEAA